MSRDDANGDFVVPVDPNAVPGDATGQEHSAQAWRRRRHHRTQPDVLGAIAAGGALGAPARYEVTQLIHTAKGSFPWATFWTNISGSLMLGFLLIVVIERFPSSRYLRPFFATGFLGAYTTFSTYMIETNILIKDGQAAVGVTYLVASAVAGLAAVWVGILAGHLAQVDRAAPETP